MKAKSSNPPFECLRAATGTSVFVIDNEEAIRRPLLLALEAEGCRVRFYPDPSTFIAVLSDIDIVNGCVLTELRTNSIDAIQLLQELRNRKVNLPVVVMSGQASISAAVRVMKAGAFDFVEKPLEAEILLKVIKSAGEAHASRRMAELGESGSWRQVFSEAAKRIDALSKRERTVLDRLVRGMSNKVIAHELGLSTRTVEMHRMRLMERLHARSLSEAVRLALLAELFQTKAAATAGTRLHRATRHKSQEATLK